MRIQRESFGAVVAGNLSRLQLSKLGRAFQGDHRGGGKPMLGG